MSTLPFVEGPAVYKILSASMSNSHDTRQIDPFRQGVELTLDPYFYDGIVKIHAGEPKHQLPQRQFGELSEQIFEQTSFLEVDFFDPLKYIRQQTLTGAHPTLTYPVIFKTSILSPGNVLDGIIEPLAIRHVASFTSIDAPFEAHSVYGNLESGNHNKFTHADQVLQRVLFSQENRGVSPYEDNVDNFQGMPTNVGFFPNNSQVISPFLDSQLKSGVMQDQYMSSSIISATLAMKPASDSYVPTGYKTYSSGFGWLNRNGIGADSIAYGNLTYKPNLTKPNLQPLDTGMSIAQGLMGATWLLPSISSTDFGYAANCAANTTTTVAIGGTPTRVYNVTLRIRGVVELKTYKGGVNDGAYFQINGTPANDTYNVYSMTITGNPNTYYFNKGTSGNHFTTPLDYQVTIPMMGGSIVTLFANSVDSVEIANNTDGYGGFPITIPGISTPPQPYNGQFIRIDVISVL